MTTKPKESLRKYPESFTDAAVAISRNRIGSDVSRSEDHDLGGAQMHGQRRMLSVAEFCNCYGIGKTMAYAEMAAGRLQSLKRGKRRLIPVDGAEAWAKPAPIAGDCPSIGEGV